MFLRRSYMATWLAACGWSLLAAAPVAAQSRDDAGERIEVSAEEAIEAAGDTISARGNVEIRRGTTVFGADTVEVHRARRTLRARGSVRLDDPRYRLRAAEIEMNLDEETARLLDAEVFIEDARVRVRGSRVEKFAGQTWEVRDGLFTTCLCEEGAPPWRIGARRLRLQDGGKAVVNDATFYVYDVPVLYLPYASAPYLTERATGLLTPSFGWSRRDGLLYRQPFFWVLGESNDVTFDFAIESRTRVGLTGQVRTVLHRNSGGRLDFSYFNERMRDSGLADDASIADPTVPLDRWTVGWTYRHGSPSSSVLFSDAGFFSDSFAPRDLAEFAAAGADDSERLRTSRTSASRLGFHWPGRDMLLAGQVDYLQDWVQPQERALHRAPHLSFTGFRGLGRGVGVGWNMELTHYMREHGTDGLRVDVRPELTWRVPLARDFRMDSRVALRETLYRLDSTEESGAAAGVDSAAGPARNGSRELVEVGWRLSTALSRNYGWNVGRWSRMRHVVQPAVEYLFIPATDQSRLPLWDPVDRIRPRNLLTVALNNRFWGASGPRPGASPRGGEDATVDTRRPPPPVGPFARARVAASLDIDETRAGGDGLSDVAFGVRVDPASHVRASLELGMDPGPWKLQSAEVGFSLSDAAPVEAKVPDRDFQRPSSVSLGYRFIRANALSPLARHANLDLLADCPSDPRCNPRDPLNGVRAGAVLRATERVLLLYDGNYDGAEGRWTGNRLGFKYLSRCECWTMTLSVEQRTNPDRTGIGFKFNLLGLGS